MSKDKNSAVFHEVYPEGKIRMAIGEITETFVTATCSMYGQRTDADGEFLITEIGIVERTADWTLSEAMAEAKEMAYENAMAKITPRGKEAKAPTVIPSEPAASAEPEQEPAVGFAPEPNEMDIPTGLGKPDNPGPDEPDASPSTVERVDLFARSPEPEEPDPGEQAIQSARSVTITILGKMNECNGKTAGQILDTAPEVIVEFAPQYTGPKEDQKKALKTLYPEALRRCSSKAA